MNKKFFLAVLFMTFAQQAFADEKVWIFNCDQMQDSNGNLYSDANSYAVGFAGYLRVTLYTLENGNGHRPSKVQDMKMVMESRIIGQNDRMESSFMAGAIKAHFSLQKGQNAPIETTVSISQWINGTIYGAACH